MKEGQYRLIVDGARRHGARFPTTADWLDFKAAIDAVFALEKPTEAPPTPEAVPQGNITDDAFVRLFQARFGLKVDGWAGPETIAKIDELAPPKVIATDISSLPDDYWPMLSKIESADRPYVQAPTSTASGLYQFIRSTWIGEGGLWGTDSKGKPIMRPAFGGLKPTPGEQLMRVKTFTAKNAAHLRKRNIPINRASLYAAHFLGKVTAAAVIGADVKADAAAIAGPAATKANLSIFTRSLPNKKRRNATVGEFLTWLHKKTGEWAR